MNEMNETNLLRSIMLAMSKALPNVRLFRNNTGMAWVGKLLHRTGTGTVAIENARPLHAGLCVGSSDLIGWTSVLITPDMVGQTIAVFTAIEVKQRGKRPTNEQVNFMRNVREAGGISILANHTERSVSDLKIISNSMGSYLT